MMLHSRRMLENGKHAEAILSQSFGKLQKRPRAERRRLMNAGSIFLDNRIPLVAKARKEQERLLDNTGVCITHVKDGKPLTPHGAALLGVEWKEE